MLSRRLQRPRESVGARGPLCGMRAGSAALVMLALLLCIGRLASAEQQPTFAVVETDKELAPLADLLTAQLSEQGVQLVERKQLDAILQEQALSAAGLTERANLVKVGRLVRADAFVLLSVEKGKDASLLRVRVAETAHGVRLLDALEAWDPRKVQEAAGVLAGSLKRVVDKLKLPAGQVVAVGIIDVRRSLLGEEQQWLCRALRGALSARLSVEPRIVVLEREDLDLLMQEKALTSGEQAGFWRSAVLIDGLLSPAGKGMELKLSLQGARGKEEGTVTVAVAEDDPAGAVQSAAAQLVPKLTEAAAGGSWDMTGEAAQYYRQGVLLDANNRPAEALAALSTACALSPQDAGFTMRAFTVAMRAESGLADVELAELAARALALASGREEALLGAMWFTDGVLGQYLGRKISTRDPRAREINRKTRRLWAEVMARTFHQAAGMDHVWRPDYWSLSVAVLSSDTAAGALENVKQALTQNVFPAERGGKYKSLAQRVQTVQFWCDTQRLAANTGYLRDEEASFYSQFFAYLAGLAKDEDPAVRIAADRIMLEMAGPFYMLPPGVQNTPESAACSKALLEAYGSLPPSVSASLGAEGVAQMYVAVWMSSGATAEKVRITEHLLEPYIEKGDVEALLTCFGAGYVDWDTGSEEEAAGHYVRLMQRVRKVLETKQTDPKTRDRIAQLDWSVNGTLDQFRTRLAGLKSQRDSLARAGQAAAAATVQQQIDRYVEALPALASSPAEVGLRVRTLITGKEWPLPWQWRWEAWPYAQVQCDDGLVWVALSDNNCRTDLKREAGLVGLDPRGGGPAALWQATAKSRHSGLGWLQGLVLGKDHCYVALKDAGILVLPGTAVRGVGALQTTRVLGPTDGLPAGTIAAIAGTPERMWVGYGRAGEESGLGLYNALTGQWKTCFSSMVKGDSPLSAGDSYRITQIAPLPEGAALSVSASSALARDGIWHYDLRSDKLQRLAQVPECYLSAGTLEEPWFKNANTLLYLDLKDKTVNVALHGYYDYKVEPADGGWSINRSAFAPQDEGRLLGPWHFGYIDLTTAAVHGDQLWARSGKTQIAVLRRGQKVGDAQKIENNILDGGPVLQFFETPYGLLAVGQGSVGIIETGPDQHAPQGEAAPAAAGGKEIVR